MANVRTDAVEALRVDPTQPSLGTVEPAEAITVVESVFRRAIRVVLGDAWRADVDEAQLEARKTEETKSRNGAVVESDLLAYTHLYDLKKIINRHWDDFKPIFKDKKRFTVYMDRLEDFRNVPMHSRTLLQFERDLLAGIAGEFRNSFTLWRSAQAADMTFYPRMELLTDSFGNTPNTGGPTRIEARLQVGQEVEFRCVGQDPQDRELTWQLWKSSHLAGSPLDEKTGSEVTLMWTVAEDEVGDDAMVEITMKSSGKYHRSLGKFDGHVSLIYAVDPPNS